MTLTGNDTILPIDRSERVLPRGILPWSAARAACRSRVVPGDPVPAASACRGFTLLELMATIAVAAVLVTVGIPSFAEIIRNNRVTSQTNELVTALNLARAEAIRRGRNVQVAVVGTTDGWSATVAVAGVAGDPLRVIDRGSSAITLNSSTVIFAPTGAPLATAAFELQPYSGCSGTQRRRVAIALSGQITTTRETCV